jgi:transcriptional regulator with XRE-family HTH domain
LIFPVKSTKNVEPISPAQCRAARALIGLTQAELAARAALGVSTIIDFEKQRRGVSEWGLHAIKSALEKEGLAFSPGGVSVAQPSEIAFAERRAFINNIVEFHPHDVLGSQVRAARALLRWNIEDLAQATALSVNTIRRIEAAESQKPITRANRIAIRRALEAAGIIFIDENGGGPGVRLHNRGERP